MESLSIEQQCMLRKVEVQAQEMSREELITALCEAWEAKYRLQQMFASIGQSVGLRFAVHEQTQWQPPETIEQFAEILGYVPTDEEAMEFMHQMAESATMELDMDEIVLTPDEDSGM